METSRPAFVRSFGMFFNGSGGGGRRLEPSAERDEEKTIRAERDGGKERFVNACVSKGEGSETHARTRAHPALPLHS